MKAAALVIRENKEEIIDLWEKTVRKEIPEVKETEHLVLLNIVPRILDDVAEVLEKSYGKKDIVNDINLGAVVEESIDHGRHRATSANYNEKRLVKEQIILHKILIIILKEHNAYQEDVGIVLSLVIENSMSHSVKSFSASLQDMREKLIGTLAHDIRNPLSTALLGLRAVDYEDGEEQVNLIIGMATKSLNKAIHLVENLLDAITVKSGEGISLVFSEGDIVKDVKLVYSEATENFPNKFVFDSRKKEIIGVFASTAVRRLLENLITNAVKYGAPEKPITVSIIDEPENVILKVHNFGNPINSENREKIFDFLNRLDQDSGGELQSWGIGLTFVKMAAEAHGGHVELESDTDQGTTFSVFLPKHSNKPGKKRALLNFK